MYPSPLTRIVVCLVVLISSVFGIAINAAQTPDASLVPPGFGTPPSGASTPSFPSITLTIEAMDCSHGNIDTGQDCVPLPNIDFSIERNVGRVWTWDIGRTNASGRIETTAIYRGNHRITYLGGAQNGLVPAGESRFWSYDSGEDISIEVRFHRDPSLD